MQVQGIKQLAASLAVLALLLGLAAPAQALLPAVRGQVELLVHRAAPGAFGVTIAPGTTFLADLEAVLGDGSVFPQDGLAHAEVTDFYLQIGDTEWDETMKPAGSSLFFTFLFGDGSVRGLAGEITPYNPAHADLIFQLPASPGVWEAVDRTLDPSTGAEVYRGLVAGTYDTAALRVVPLPGALGLFGFGLLLLGCRLGYSR